MLDEAASGHPAKVYLMNKKGLFRHLTSDTQDKHRFSSGKIITNGFVNYPSITRGYISLYFFARAIKNTGTMALYWSELTQTRQSQAASKNHTPLPSRRLRHKTQRYVSSNAPCWETRNNITIPSRLLSIC